MTGKDHEDSISRPRFRRSVVLLSMIVLWLLRAVSIVHAQQPSEFQLKATYLYNFGKFVEWPPWAVATQNQMFNVCVIGEDPFGPTLDKTFENEHIAGKNAAARRISKAAEALSCSILFVSSSENGHVKEILSAVDRNGVLTVSDLPEFVKLGGMIQFVLDGSRIRFQINRGIAENSGLKLSSELLRVAAKVTP